MQETKLKPMEVCRPIPEILLPFYPPEVIEGSPAWLTPVPRIKRLKRGDCILLDDVLFRDRRGRYRRTPRGFPNDGMSYPWLVRAVTGWDKYDPATIRSAATHDCPYSMKDHLCKWPLKRKEVDVDLLDGLRAELNSGAWIKYRNVRRWGWIPWGIKTCDPLVISWIDCLLNEEDLDLWIEKVLEKEAA